jgi:hypothetical protein
MLNKLAPRGLDGLDESGDGKDHSGLSSRKQSLGGLNESHGPSANKPRTSASRRSSIQQGHQGGRRNTRISSTTTRETRQAPAEPTVSVIVGGGEFNMVARPGRLAALNVIRSMDNGNEQDSTIPLPARSHLNSHLSMDSDIEDFQLFMTETRHPAIVIDVLSDPHDKTIVSEFDELCNELLSCLGELEISIEELTLFKGPCSIL